MKIPETFSVNWRNPGHWDVYTGNGRAFRIRGEPGYVQVSDERRGDGFGTGTRPWLLFETVNSAMAWIALQLMAEPKENFDAGS